MSMPVVELQSLFNHLCVPPHVPCKAEDDLCRINDAISERLESACRRLQRLTANSTEVFDFNRLISVVKRARALNAGGRLDRASLTNELRCMQSQDCLILYIVEQNAGLLVHRTKEDFIFEAFEASALSECVLAAHGPLVIDFPGNAASVHYQTLIADGSFLGELAAFLEQAAVEQVGRFAACAYKAGRVLQETRNTCDPAVITQLLMTIVEAKGRRISPRLLRKRVRDDVCWSEGAERPWRRSPFWLVLRVGIQRCLLASASPELGRTLYKLLICTLLVDLLDASVGQLHPECVWLIKAKVARRLAKLESDKDAIPSSKKPGITNLLNATGSYFMQSLQKANDIIEGAWSNFKRKTQRPIPPLAYNARANDLRLSLQNSAPYLDFVLNTPLQPDLRFAPKNVSTASNSLFSTFAEKYYALQEIESELEHMASSVGLLLENGCLQDRTDLRQHIQRTARGIHDYVERTQSVYSDDAEQCSGMILTVMEQFALLDRLAIEMYPLLQEYAPTFDASALDVLILLEKNRMERLLRVQQYLNKRHSNCNNSHLTIFADPSDKCFAVRYYDSSASSKLRELHCHIEADAQKSRERKEQEWRRLDTEYAKLTREIAELSCTLRTEQDPISCLPYQVHDDDRCSKCYLKRKARRIKIEVHEHPLPTDTAQAKAAVFELTCPGAFAQYRAATWKIIQTLSNPGLIPGRDPTTVLRAYEPLKKYLTSRPTAIQLGSSKKSFLLTHYAVKRFPVELADICVESGLQYGYFDSSSKIWPGRQWKRPSFVHHFSLQLPKDSPFRSIVHNPEYEAGCYGPSSNQVIASQTRCPAGVNINEWMAFQNLYSGHVRCWPNLLLELGSSNLNFSTEAANALVTRVALEAGPLGDVGVRRLTHSWFEESTFCFRLLEVLEKRVVALSTNWREVGALSLLLTITLRSFSLISDLSLKCKAKELIESIRSIASGWVKSLRLGIHSAADPETSRTFSHYSLRAALLCRRTFSIYNELGHLVEGAALEPFIDASIAMQDNINGEPAKISSPVFQDLVRDLKMVWQLRSIVQQSVHQNPDTIGHAIAKFLPHAEGDSPCCTQPCLLPGTSYWVQFDLEATATTLSQTIQLHLTEGHLLVDGYPVGKLPQEHSKSLVFVELFGSHSLLVYPSNMPGMQYKLAISIYGHQIHLGLRRGAHVIRAFGYGAIRELIPRDRFKGAQSFDLPSELIENCIHWLDINTGMIEIRPKPDIWRQKSSNWILDFPNRRAQRRNSLLINPQSELSTSLYRLFEHFENPYNITAYQAVGGVLRVQLRRLELGFKRNSAQRLECYELNAEVDPNQDAGCWYGLNSKLVFRDVVNPSQRMVLVPMGAISYRRSGAHASVFVENTGLYARYSINDALGKLDSAGEPVFLYLKALLHAYTSFVVPDPLTGLTGTEEALRCLKSGQYQPWQPLKSKASELLNCIARLTPKRSFYPEDIRQMQKVLWDSNLSTTIQHDELRPVVELICTTSTRLAAFSQPKVELQELDPAGDVHLTIRALLRRAVFQRANAGALVNDGRLAPVHHRDESPTPIGIAYQALTAISTTNVHVGRDQAKETTPCRNVFEIVQLLERWPQRMCTTDDLAGILQGWDVISGLNERYDGVSLGSQLTPEFDTSWGRLVQTCRHATNEDKSQLIFLLAPMAFSETVDMGLLRSLLAFAIFSELRELEPPPWPTYSHFRYGQSPSEQHIIGIIKSCTHSYGGDGRSDLGLLLAPKQRRKLIAAQLVHEKQTEEDLQAFAHHLLALWPTLNPDVTDYTTATLVKVPEAMCLLLPEWQRLVQNSELASYIQKVQTVLNRRSGELAFVKPPQTTLRREFYLDHNRDFKIPSLASLLCKQGPVSDQRQGYTNVASRDAYKSSRVLPNGHRISQLPSTVHKPNPAVKAEVVELESILGEINNTRSIVRERYARDLRTSIDALKVLPETTAQGNGIINFQAILSEVSEAQRTLHMAQERLEAALALNDERSKWLKQGQLWPSTTVLSLIEQLRSRIPVTFGKGMKEALVAYAVSITHLQRLQRIRSALCRHQKRKALEEWSNFGHETWNPLDYPDWLLIELEADILIRTEQIDVALATIRPESLSNSLLLFLMGGGKSSVIIPMAAALLANSKKLLRVMVPRALLLQTAQVLQARLGGLLGREVRHVPSSRRTASDETTIREYYSLHMDMLQNGGLILMLPEHAMSFRLSGLQRLSEDSRLSEAGPMIKIQRWLDKISRDILDESDAILSVRTQLIYPSGVQLNVDGDPWRWEVIEKLLHLVYSHLPNLKLEFPHSLEILEKQSGGFPVIYFLRRDVEEALITRLVDDVSEGRMHTLHTESCTTAQRSDIIEFISDERASRETQNRLFKLFADNLAAQQTLLLLRGLIVYRILLLTLKKRHNVQYGLHPNRDPIAVPYHAKGVPSEQAEFGHPDVSLLFTVLSFYFGGLTILQLKDILKHLLQSDDPSSHWEIWIQTLEKLPNSLCDWGSINPDDLLQLRDLWQYLRHCIPVIDYYLNCFVFPRHAKQFSTKLQCSGWDLPIFDATSDLRAVASRPPGVAQGTLTCSVAKQKLSLSITTGFSGTSDDRALFPLTIQQRDLPSLAHTNAQVLSYLLQPRNRGYVLAADMYGRHLSERNLLRLLESRKLTILIDAGAQIMELSNLGLAQTWLSVSKAVAAAYFDDDNRLLVVYRNGHKVPLSASTFADNMDGCLLFIDQAHCRGTDVRLPSTACGALTLSLEQTKDHTVQAAMRMRQLGTTQSTVWISPPEVHQSIADFRQKHYSAIFDSKDIIAWSLEQSCHTIEGLQPLFHAQGTDFCKRAQAFLDFPDYLKDKSHRDALVQLLRQPERQSLEQLYGVRSQSKTTSNSKSLPHPVSSVGVFVKQLANRRRGFRDTGVAVHGSALSEVEQEREVHQEAETVREVQKPFHYKPLVFGRLHPDVVTFIRTGGLAVHPGGIESVFAIVRRTTLGRKYQIQPDATSQRCWASTEFSRTIQIPTGRSGDNFMRPVHWILFSRRTELAVVICPEEVELAIPLLREGSLMNEAGLVHLLSYSAPVTRKMLHFNALTFFSVPPLPPSWQAPTWLKIELGIFAGRLYFGYDEYEDICSFLGLQSACPTRKVTVMSNGDIDDMHAEDDESGPNQAQKKPFATKPQSFLQSWLDLRRKGGEIGLSPMGYLAQGKSLNAAHPFFKDKDMDEDVDEGTQDNSNDTGRLFALRTGVAEVLDNGGTATSVTSDDDQRSLGSTDGRDMQ